MGRGGIFLEILSLYTNASMGCVRVLSSTIPFHVISNTFVQRSALTVPLFEYLCSPVGYYPRFFGLLHGCSRHPSFADPVLWLCYNLLWLSDSCLTHCKHIPGQNRHLNPLGSIPGPCSNPLWPVDNRLNFHRIYCIWLVRDNGWHFIKISCFYSCNRTNTII